MDMPILCNIRAEDIEDVSERYIPMFTEERNSDTVKRIKITEKDTFYFISLIEHKTKVFRYIQLPKFFHILNSIKQHDK